MIPIKEAISSGAWLHCSSDDGSIQFRLRVLSFGKINLADVDNPQNIKQTDSNAKWWLMKIEVVSLCKKNISPDRLFRNVLLVDQDGFEFNVTEDSHLSSSSGFSIKSGLKRFYFGDLIPKVKANGAISFLLPDDDEAQYSLSMGNGTVREA